MTSFKTEKAFFASCEANSIMDPVPDLEQAQLPPSSTPERPPSRPSLLPAFEPSSSSPSLPRPSKRKYVASPSKCRANLHRYPTPVPTSSTGIISSSPPALPVTRPILPRSHSTVSERVPLGNVPSVVLPLNGEPVLMGRSSNSSHYQLSANRLISRVHVRAAYRKASDDHELGQVIIECLGWNGTKVHCRGTAVDLAKGDTFSSDKPRAEIILDVQDARVLIRWPIVESNASMSTFSDGTWEDEDSPRRALTPTADRFASSPPQPRLQLESPISPSPRYRPQLTDSSTFLGLPSVSSLSPPPVEVYEDHASSEEPLPSAPESAATAEPESATSASKASQSSGVYNPADDFSDQDEENDPIIHSFGPFGENLLPRMASFYAVSPERARRPPLINSTSPQQRTSLTSEPSRGKSDPSSPICNHVINQLAFSRLHALPLSTIMTNLPAALKGKNISPDRADNRAVLTNQSLKKLLDNIACVGEIVREGKDAAGKPLEDEFYYVPELDTDTMRRTTVQENLGPGLRSVRKQHKVRCTLFALVVLFVD